MARSSQAACHSFLILRRVMSVCARFCVALRLTLVVMRTQPISSGMPGLRFNLGFAHATLSSSHYIACTVTAKYGLSPSMKAPVRSIKAQCFRRQSRRLFLLAESARRRE